MKSLVLVRHGSPASAFDVKDLPDPVPQPGEVLIDVEASGVNFADILAVQGLYQDAPPLPAVLGYEVVGRVVSIGPTGRSGGASDSPPRFKVGQRVLAFTRFGGYAKLARASSLATVPIPDDWDAAETTALGTQYSTALFAAEEAVRLHPGDFVLIQAAAGGVGTALVQLAKRRGCVVFGTAGGAEKIRYLTELGVDHPIDYQAGDFAEQFLAVSAGRKADVVFDSLGGAGFRKGMALLGPGGRMVSYGAAEMSGSGPKWLGVAKMAKTAVQFGLLQPIALLVKSQGVIGVNMLRIADHQPERLGRVLTEVVELRKRDEIRPRLGRSFPAAQVAQAHEFVASRRSIGKVALVW